MVTSNAVQQQQAVHDADKTVQVAEAYSYLSDQKDINLDSIPLPLTPPPTAHDLSSNSTRSISSPPTCSYNLNLLDTVDSFEVLEQTIIKQKRLARFKNTDLRRKILLKRTFDLVCEIMDHENGFDFEDETETINKKQESSSKKTDEDEDDEDSGSESDSDSSDDSDDDDDDSSSSSSSDESDDEEEEDVEEDEESPIKQDQYDQLIPKPSESKTSLKIKLAWSSDKHAAKQQQPSEASPGDAKDSNESSAFSKTDSDPLPSLSQDLLNQEPSEDLDFTELNSVDITESYDDSAFNLDQVTFVDEQTSNNQLYELKTFNDTTIDTSSSPGLKRKRNSFEETVHQTEHEYFGNSSCCDSTCARNSDQQLLCLNSSLGSLSDSTFFYNNHTSVDVSIKSTKRSFDESNESDSKRLKAS